MNPILFLCVAAFLAGCRAEQTPKPKPEVAPKIDVANPVTGPIGIGEHLKADLRKRNAGQQVRRQELEEIFEKK